MASSGTFCPRPCCEKISKHTWHSHGLPVTGRRGCHHKGAPDQAPGVPFARLWQPDHLVLRVKATTLTALAEVIVRADKTLVSRSNHLTTGSLWSRAGKMEVIFCSRSLNLDAVSSFNTNLRVSSSFSWIKVTLKERVILNFLICFLIP